jgi:pSer/pThr/pTyr-binding forkhead associated (FHA) protein
MQIPQTKITITRDGENIAQHVVEPGEYVIGREAECEIVVPVEGVSRRHAKLTVNYSELLIEDAGSSNGTFVNGKPVKEATRLWPNQKIQIGTAVIELHRVKTGSSSDHSLAPSAATMRRILPDEFLREKK